MNTYRMQVCAPHITAKAHNVFYNFFVFNLFILWLLFDFFFEPTLGVHLIEYYVNI